EPLPVHQQADHDLWINAPLLGVADLAQAIFVFGLKIQGVGSVRGAVATLLSFRFPGPPAEPAVRLSTQRALHEVMPVRRSWPGRKDWGSLSRGTGSARSVLSWGRTRPRPWSRWVSSCRQGGGAIV